MTSFRSTLIVLTALFLPIFGPTPRVAADDVDVEELYKKVVKSCVFIITPLKGGYAMGSGSLIDLEQRIVLTNHHVVDGSDIVFVQFPIPLKDGEILTDKEKYKERVPRGLAIKGKVMYKDQSRDLAFVKLDKVPPGTPALPLAKKSVGVGATVWNIGSPGAVAQVFSITEGKVRAVGVEKFLVGGGETIFEIRAKMVTTTNPSNQGDSGGPLFDRRGYQVAVTQSGNRSAQLVSKFVDVSEVRALLNEKKLTIKELSTEPDPKDATLSTPSLDPGPGPTPSAKKEPGTTPPAAKKEAAPAATAADEKAAGDLLRRARLFANSEDARTIYVTRLKEVIKKYPGTMAARDAQKLLDNLN